MRKAGAGVLKEEWGGVWVGSVKRGTGGMGQHARPPCSHARSVSQSVR